MRMPLMTTGRWMVCIAFCAIGLAAGMAYHRWVEARLDAKIQEARKRAGLSPEAPMNDFGVPLPGYMMTLITLDHFLMKFWFVLLLLVFLIGFGIAWSLPSKPGVSRTQSASSEIP